MSRRKGQLLLTVVLIILVFSIGTRIVEAEELTEQGEGARSQAEEVDTDEIQKQVEDALMSEFDFDEIEESLEDMFPGEKISFQDVVISLMSGEPEKTGELLVGYFTDLMAYEFRYNRHNLVYILLIALAAAVFRNFAGAFQNKQISDISFYVLYMLLLTLCLTSF